MALRSTTGVKGSADGGRTETRISRGEVARRSKSARRLGISAVAATAAIAMPLAGALAECQRPANPAATVFDFIPLASGATVASIISTIGAVNNSSLAQSGAYVGIPPGAKPDQQGGGNWSRVIVGEVETKADTSTTAVIPIAGTVDCRTTTKQEFTGTQAGMDIGRLNFAGGGNIHWGITAGYFNVKTKDRTAGLGQFSGEADVPFAGLYMALSSGNFSFDAQVRGDYFQMQLSDVDQGMFNQNVTARGIAFIWNASYRFDLPNNWFIEPSVGGVSSRTSVDSFSVAGGGVLPLALTPSLTFPGTIDIDDINSLLGRASLRVGTVVTTGNLVLAPFATASVFREFAGAVRTNISTLDIGIPLQAQSTTDRVGTFGHIGLGIAGTIIDTGWLGYARVDYRFGEDIEGLSFNAGLRYQWAPPREAAASLKDGEAPAAYAPTAFNWTGFYAGWSSGALWGEQDWTFEVDGSKVSPKHQGYLVGGQVGYNHQFGKLVLGVEADYSWTNAEGGRSCPGFAGFFFNCATEVDNIAFFTGRIGLAHQRALYYLRGGIAVADVTSRTVDGLAIPFPPDISAGTSVTATGWAFGAGMEFAVSDRWTVKGEWLRYDLGHDRYTVTNGAVIRADTTGDVARIGINYHFGHRHGSESYEAPLK